MACKRNKEERKRERGNIDQIPSVRPLPQQLPWQSTAPFNSLIITTAQTHSAGQPVWPPVPCVCVCVCVPLQRGAGVGRGKFRFFKPMNPIIRPLTAHFFVHKTVSLMKCPESKGGEGGKKKISFTQEYHNKHAESVMRSNWTMETSVAKRRIDKRLWVLLSR